MAITRDMDSKGLLLDVLITGCLAMIVFGPVLGIILEGYDFRAEPARPVIMTLLVMAGRLVFGLWRRNRLRHPSPPEQRVSALGERLAAASQSKILIFLIPVFLTILPFLLSKYWLSVVILTLIYVLLGMGLNIVVGLAGLLDLGFVAFYAVGAYGYALGHQYLGLGFWTALPFAAALAGLFGILLGFPVLRLHGDYLAIVTLGFGEIISLVLTNWIEFTGGPNGVNAPLPTLFGLEFRRRAKQGGTPFYEFFGIEYGPAQRYIFIYLCLLAIVCLIAYSVYRLKRMPVGRAWEALREDEIACRSLGVNHATVKLAAFSLGATIGGIAGVFFAGFQGFIDPLSFNFFESALILAIVVLGGPTCSAGVTR